MDGSERSRSRVALKSEGNERECSSQSFWRASGNTEEHDDVGGRVCCGAEACCEHAPGAGAAVSCGETNNPRCLQATYFSEMSFISLSSSGSPTYT